MKLCEMKIGDILLIDGIPYKRTEWFSCETSDGDPYYKLDGPTYGPTFKMFTGHEQIVHFSENVYIIEETNE